MHSSKVGGGPIGTFVNSGEITWRGLSFLVAFLDLRLLLGRGTVDQDTSNDGV